MTPGRLALPRPRSSAARRLLSRRFREDNPGLLFVVAMETLALSKAKRARKLSVVEGLGT